MNATTTAIATTTPTTPTTTTATPTVDADRKARIDKARAALAYATTTTVNATAPESANVRTRSYTVPVAVRAAVGGADALVAPVAPSRAAIAVGVASGILNADAERDAETIRAAGRVISTVARGLRDCDAFLSHRKRALSIVGTIPAALLK